jgi:hypothetical protein
MSGNKTIACSLSLPKLLLLMVSKINGTPEQTDLWLAVKKAAI